MDRGNLDYGAAGRDQPVEAFAYGEQGDGACCGVALRDAFDGVELRIEFGEIELGPECLESRVIGVDKGVQVLTLQAEQDDAAVQELFAFDAGYDAYDAVAV